MRRLEGVERSELPRFDAVAQDQLNHGAYGFLMGQDRIPILLDCNEHHVMHAFLDQ